MPFRSIVLWGSKALEPANAGCRALPERRVARTLIRALALFSADCLVVLSLSGCGDCTFDAPAVIVEGKWGDTVTCNMGGISKDCCDAAKKVMSCMNDAVDAAGDDASKFGAEMAKCNMDTSKACSNEADAKAAGDMKSACK